MQDFLLIISLISLGFFGGFSHCAGMCGPFVLTQVSNRLQKTSLENFSSFQKLKNLALLPYQAGRITTYSLIGLLSSLLSQNISDFTNFKFFSAALLFAASLFFLSSFFKSIELGKSIKVRPHKSGFTSRMMVVNFALRFKAKLLKKLPSIFSLNLGFLRTFLSKLFLDPKGLRGYVLGLILGFIPCGLLYGAFLIAAAISNPFLAAFGMLLFGIATFPALFITASGGYFLTKLPEFKLFAKIIILINAVMLFLMAVKLIK